MNSRISRTNSNSSVNSELHYVLPLDIEQISNYQDILSTFQLTEAAQNMLFGSGFVVIRHPTMQYKSTRIYPTGITEVYKKLREYDVPILVTSDSLLHTFHTAVDNIMKIMEENILFDRVLKLTNSFLSESTIIYNNLNDEENDLKVAAGLNIAYFSVALKLLNYEANVPSQVVDLVTSEVANIDSSSQISDSPIFGYDVDYTQFTMRGHYSDTKKLEKYFKTLMWYGMMNFELSNSVQIIRAALIAYILSKNEVLRNEFDGMKIVTEFFAGTADDIGPNEFLNVMNGIVIGNFNLQLLTDEDFLKQLKTALDKLPPPRIMGGTSVQRMLVPSFSQEIMNKKLEESRGMRLIGQRFTIDSYIFTNLVLLKYTGDTAPFTAVGTIRGFPRGLDAMAVLGSNSARVLLDKLGDSNYKDYDEIFARLQTEVNIHGDNTWNKDVYHGWLYSLRALLGKFDDRYPTFMLTKAWEYKELTTALASWTALRHDAILYAKQSYTALLGVSVPPPKSTTLGYVEPVPELYNMILSLVNAFPAFLKKRGASTEDILGGVARLKNIVQNMKDISLKELNSEVLSEEEYDFIRDYGLHLASVNSHFESGFRNPRDVIAVADVHTDLNSETVLEEGIGYLKVLLVAFKLPDGKISIGAGPVLSYYEFKQTMRDRLNDESWKKLLNSESCPHEPEWISVYSA